MAMAGLLAVALGILLVSRLGKAQIPEPCANAANFTNRECCPTPNIGSDAGPCGSNLNRGECVNIGMESIGDPRDNWPHFYFTRVCMCNTTSSSNYGGYDCGECAFGYQGPNCDQRYIRPRRSASSLSDLEWSTYIDQLRMAKFNFTSRYRVITAPPPANLEELETVPLTVYDLFVWLHHYAAKDNDYGGPDYAHEATGFPTWHRLFLLWFEQEMQYHLNDNNFTVHYWDWRDPNERRSLFRRDRLGEHDSQTSAVTGRLFEDWATKCWYSGSGSIPPPVQNMYICDPRNDTGPIQRCPDKERCAANYTGWPTYQDVQDAVDMGQYDMPDYNAFSTGFRNYMEGFLVVDQCDNQTDRGRDLCNTKTIGGTTENVQRLLHNTGHLILGIGRFDNSFQSYEKGVMGDVAASANDPIFINHHTMVDCIFEEWLKQNNRTATYPNPTDRSIINMGHRRDDYIVPFIPLFTHEMMFKTADNFGYSCNLDLSGPTETTESDSAKPATALVLYVLVPAIVSIVTLIL